MKHKLGKLPLAAKLLIILGVAIGFYALYTLASGYFLKEAQLPVVGEYHFTVTPQDITKHSPGGVKWYEENGVWTFIDDFGDIWVFTPDGKDTVTLTLENIPFRKQFPGAPHLKQIYEVAIENDGLRFNGMMLVESSWWRQDRVCLNFTEIPAGKPKVWEVTILIKEEE